MDRANVNLDGSCDNKTIYSDVPPSKPKRVVSVEQLDDKTDVGKQDDVVKQKGRLVDASKERQAADGCEETVYADVLPSQIAAAGLLEENVAVNGQDIIYSCVLVT